MTTSAPTRTAPNPNLWALSGALFALLFIAGDVLRGQLATDPLPLPSASAEAYARYVLENRAAVLVVGACQLLSALALFVFVRPVSTFAHRVAGERKGLAASVSSSGVLSAGLLLVCAPLGLVGAAVAGSGDLGLIGTLRQANFLTGGTLHVAALGVMIGGTALAARRTRALPQWLVWLGLVQGAIAVLSLASLVFYYANALILFGRLLGFVWCVAAGLVLAFGGRSAVRG